MNGKLPIAAFIAFLALAATAVAQPDSYCGQYTTTTLYAGQTIDSGDVIVWNDADHLYVKFVTEDGWELTETHLAVETKLADIPQTKTGNPKPGNFEYSTTHNPAVTEYTYVLDKGDGPYYIAAHAVVKKTTVLQAAPYYASAVVSYQQGLRKDGTPVLAARSIPAQGLVLETGQSQSNFFSLGFGGNFVAEFSCKITNGEGSDVKVWEDTWGAYPLEKANVYASQDGTNWVLLGVADNTNYVGIQTVSSFDLGALAWAKYIKVVDISDPALFPAEGDGFDLNAISTLQDCTSTQQETGWGNGTGFSGKNWAMYFRYTVQQCKTLNLPSTLSMSIYAYPGGNNYFDLQLSNIGPGYDINNGVWDAWCADSHVYIYTGTTYADTKVWMSNDPNLATECPYCVDDEHWDKVNYILNHIPAGFTWQEVQAAIWYFTDATPIYGGFWTTNSQLLVDAANANGAGYQVPPGGWIAVIMDNGSDVQLTFLVVDP